MHAQYLSICAAQFVSGLIQFDLHPVRVRHCAQLLLHAVGGAAPHRDFLPMQALSFFTMSVCLNFKWACSGLKIVHTHTGMILT